MADAAVGHPVLNGAVVPALEPQPQPESPNSSNASMKRKRDPSDSDSAEPLADGDGNNPADTATQAMRDEKQLIHDYFHVLKSFDTTPSIFQRQITEPSLPNEPLPKRQKSGGDDDQALSIEDKVSKNTYRSLEELVKDIKQTADVQIAELKLQEDKPDANSNATIIAKIAMFRDRAVEMFRREMSYPDTTVEPASNFNDGSQVHTDENLVLTVYGNAPGPKHLFSSLPRRANLDKPSRQLQEIPLPNGLSSTRVIASAAPKPVRTPTLGELFPSPRNLPPLQPSKTPKNTTKGNVLSFYHPELTEKSKYRAGSYFSQNISTGQWLDYSNATPSSQIKTRQRERAQSLAGHKPSTTELEMSEIEALFRGAFSSFAPAKDDSAAMVSSGQLGRMWWAQVGHRSLQKMFDSQAPEDEDAGTEMSDADELIIDEELIEKALEDWDDSLVDPTLDEALGKKSDHDKDVDELLQEVSDLIETLASYQRNRNLTLPTSQDRHSTEPVNDMLRQGGQHAQQPTEEETLIYEALKAQLCLIVNTLPPYAAARVNSDKLAELNVSTKIEVRTEEQYGVMEDNEPVGRPRAQAPVVPQPAAQRPPHRTPSVSGPSPYSGHYGPGQQYTPSRPPMPNGPPYFTGRPQPPQPMHARPPMPQSPMAQHTPPRPQQQTPYRANGYPGYAQQSPKPPYPTGGHIQFQGTPSQPRMPQPGYPQVQQGTPQYQRYPPNFPGGFPQHGQPGMSPQSHHQQPHHSIPPQGYPQTNGAAHMPPRPMPGQPHPGQPHHGQPHPYGMSPQQHQMQLQQQQHQQHAAQLQQQHGRPSPVNHTQQLMPHSPQHPYSSVPAGGGSGPKLLGYSTYLDSSSQQRIIDRAQHEARNNNHNQHLARSNAQDMSRNFTSQLSAQGSPHSIGQNAGLASLGLGSTNLDMSKIAAQRASISAGQMSPSPRPHSLAPTTPSPSINGMQQQQAMQPPPPMQSVSPSHGGSVGQPPA